MRNQQAMRFQVLVPPSFAEAVARDLEARGATVSGRHDVVAISGQVSADAMVDYGTVLRDLTQGRGTYDLVHDRTEAQRQTGS